MNVGSRKGSNVLFTRKQQQPDTSRISVLNAAIASSEIFRTGRTAGFAARLDWEVLSHSGIRYVMILGSINDIGHAQATPEAQDLVEARPIHYYKQIITRLHTCGIAMFGSTITPFMCGDGVPVPERNDCTGPPIREQTRLGVNEWIRNSRCFDTVFDFDHVFRDPMNAALVAPALHCGDCLHPSNLGSRALGDNFPLDIFEKFKYGVDTFR